MEGNININSLPNEILLAIMSQMCVYDRINCKFVCLRWQQLAEKLLYEEKAFHFGHHLKICCDSDHKVIDQKGLTYYYDKVGKLLDERSLMIKILKLIPQLKSLHLYLRNEQTIDVIMENCKDIECLTLISFNDRVMLNAVAMIVKFGKTLKHLKICDESRVIARNGMEDVMANILSYCPKLEIFHLFRIQLNGKSCLMISDTIKEISTQVGSNSIRALTKRKNYSNLENLIIRDSIINLGRLRLICKSFLSIKKLFIESYSDCDNFTEFRLIGQMKQLEHLEINFMPKLHRQCISIDKELESIFTGCRNLIKISFSNCMNAAISDKCLVKMSNCCENMKHIHFWRFGDMTNVTVEGIAAFATLTKLQYLALDALHYNRNKHVLKSLSEKLMDSFKSLEFIYVMNCSIPRKP
jgi:hypothetical protein